MRETEQALKQALQAGNLPVAAPLAKALLKASPKDAKLRQTLSKIYSAMGKTAEAIAVLNDGFTVTSLNPDDYFNVAYALRGLGAFRDAIAGYHHAIGAGLSGAEDAYVNIASLEYEEFGNVSAAVDALKKALTTNPDSMEACLNLGNILEATNQFEAADTVYSEGLKRQAVGYEILARLVKLRDFDAVDDPLLNQIKLAQTGSAPPKDKALMGFAYGDALNALGQYDDAYEAYHRANQHSGISYNKREVIEYAELLKNNFPSSLFERDTAPQQKPSPLFICGMFRSGSTLLEQILGAHPEISQLGELPFFDRLAVQHGELFTQEGNRRPPKVIEHLRQAYFAQPQVSGVTTPIFTDKRPDNFLYLGLIKQIFPNALILHTRRNARDTALSIFSTQLGARQSYAGSIKDIAHYISHYQDLMAHWENCFGDDIHAVDYETLTAEPERQLRPIFETLGLPWDSACLSFYTLDNHVKTASYKQVRQPLHNASVGRWRNYAQYIEPYFID